MDSEELTKTVDNIYKNILEKFNPGARQLITAGKSYLKALHGAAAATRIFNEALAKIALNAQQSEINDIGTALLGIVGVYKEIQEQQMNILKAFYVDLLVPLETNLDKDTKVVQYEQKKFIQQQKIRMENYQKAVSTMKKQRKKKPSTENTEKEIRNLQILQEQKKKLDVFCEQSYKNAITQERRRYGFVLERQCSIAKHLMAYHATGRLILENNLENWQEVAASREIIPANMFENGADMLGLKALDRLTNFDSMNGDNMSQLKKSCSVDAPYGDMRTLHETNSSYMQNSLSRAKSDFNIASKRSSNDLNEQLSGNWDQRLVVKAIYGYKPSGENQLPFEEGDRIALVGGKANGWQFGENLRLKVFGWFPIAYTNAEGNNAATAAYDTAETYRSMENDDMKSMPQQLDMKTRNSDHGERYENMQYNSSRSDGILSDYNMQDDDGVVGIYRQMSAAAEENSSTRHMYGSDARYNNNNNSNSNSNHNNNNNNNINKKKVGLRKVNWPAGNNLVSSQYLRASPNKNPRPGPPPTLPAPVPTVQNRILNLSRSFCTPNAGPSSMIEHRRTKKLQSGSNNNNNSNGNNENSPHITHHDGNQGKSNEATKTSLHSSNDSGFANEPPPQPAVDYSDEEQNNRVPIRSYHHDSNMPEKNAMMMMKHHDVVSMTLNRSYRNSIGSQAEEKSLHGLKNTKMSYGLIASDDEILQGATGGGSIRRTKSFWKFRGKRGNNDSDILAGMSLWQHRDLVTTRKPRIDNEQHNDTGTLTHNSNSSSSSRNNNNNKMHKIDEQQQQKLRKDSFGSMAFYDGGEENIYGMASNNQEENGVNFKSNKNQNQLALSKQNTMNKNNTNKKNSNEITSTLQRVQNSYKRKMKSNVEQEIERRQERQSAMSMNGNRLTVQQQNSESESTLKKKSGVNKHYQNNRESYETDDFDNNDTLKLNKINDYFDEMTANVAVSSNGGGLLVKTVKRKDILKQYYTSDDDDDETDKYEEEEEDDDDDDDDDEDDEVENNLQVEEEDIEENVEKDIDIKSENFDPYDCIVINDHLVHKNDAAALAAHQRHQQQLRAKSYHEQEIKFQTFRTTMTKTKSLSLVPEQHINNNNNNNNNITTKMNDRKKNNHEDLSILSDLSLRDSAANIKYNNKILTTKRQGIVENLDMSSPTATILPRTRLIKSSANAIQNQKNELKGEQKIHSNSNNNNNNNNNKQNYANTYGPWFDFWDLQKQEQYFNQSLNRPQKSAKHTNKN